MSDALDNVRDQPRRSELGGELRSKLVTWEASPRTAELAGQMSGREYLQGIVDGRTPLEDLEAAIGGGVDLAPPDLDEEIDTVAGLVNALAGRVPQRREVVDHPGGFSLEVISADPRRVKRMRVRRLGSHVASHV